MRVFYSRDYTLAGYAFDTTRKAQWVAESLAETPIAQVEICAPAATNAQRLGLLHDPVYVEAVRSGAPRSLAQSQGFTWDAGMWPMVMASNGGVVDAARDALVNGVAGSLSSGLHHARRDHGAGFCTFNGLALAARAVLDAGATRVLILDLDAHCGGGTHSLISSDTRIWQTDLAVNLFDAYQPTERTTLDLVSRSEAYLPTLETRLHELDGGGSRFDVCLYNAGMDPYEGCEVGGLAGINQEMLARREALVFAWCRKHGIPVAFVLAGGYIGPRLSQGLLVDLHRLTIAAAAQPADAATP
jgi:acetoin utilization deacetylase AcuC-like enzyme